MEYSDGSESPSGAARPRPRKKRHTATGLGSGGLVVSRRKEIKKKLGQVQPRPMGNAKPIGRAAREGL